MGKTSLLIRYTIEEIVRQSFFTVMVLSTGTMIFMSPFFTLFAFYETDRLLIEMGLVSLMVSGMVLASLTASHSFYFEMRRKTVLVMMSKPIGRFQFLSGKCIGIFASISIMFLLESLLFLLMIRLGAPESAQYKVDWPVVVSVLLPLFVALIRGFYMNYFLEKSFNAAFVKTFFIGLVASFVLVGFVSKELEFTSWWPDFDIELLKGCFMTYLAIMLSAMISIFLSLFVGRDVNLIMTFSLFLLGMLSEYLFRNIPEGINWMNLMTAIIPKYHVFQVSDVIIFDKIVPAQYVFDGALYSIFFQAGLFMICYAFFRTRELS